MRRTIWIAGSALLVYTGVYVFVYLYRWEWTRALMMTAFFLAVETAVATGLILRRLGRVGGSAPASPEPDAGVVARLREAAPQRDHFAWLDPRHGGQAVFVTFLVGGGVVISALTWAIDRLAGKTTTPRRERALAAELGRIALPEGGLVVDDAELAAQDVPYRDDPGLALLLGPGTRRRP